MLMRGRQRQGSESRGARRVQGWMSGQEQGRSGSSRVTGWGGGSLGLENFPVYEVDTLCLVRRRRGEGEIADTSLLCCVHCMPALFSL